MTRTDKGSARRRTALTGLLLTPGDGGASWELTADGLPDRAWAAVLREGFAFDEGAVYFGTQSGSVWTAPQGAGSWTEAVRDLPPILSVEAATV